MFENAVFGSINSDLYTNPQSSLKDFRYETGVFNPCRTIGLSRDRTIELSKCRTIELSKSLTIGLSECRTIGLWYYGKIGRSSDRLVR
ncbi:hypothetical protein [Microcoleus sp. PH2017_27_LUM_O_A]|uniref:hypothetical protein n=1 Tax=Microcoleus sp. PH2017_27_LUM_O_A TaxID=2798837 RepID=UPI0025D4FF58|nr:hypothetical protein [Microcoleus sp. PH2017_27_LUM_O_A]